MIPHQSAVIYKRKILSKEDNILIKYCDKKRGMVRKDCLHSSQQTLATHSGEASAAKDRWHRNGQQTTWKWKKTISKLNKTKV